MKNDKKETFWAAGLRFQCQGSGRCCVSHDGYGYVYLTLEDRRRMAGVLKMSTSAFTRKHCELQDGIWRLKDGVGDQCRFLKDHRCSVYEGRPTQCRTWPFWPEVMNAKTWSKEVATFCPGVGKGKLWSPDEVERELNLQKASEDGYGS